MGEIGWGWMTFSYPDKKLTEPDQFTARDMLCIQRADIVLAYMEAENPSGIGLAAEVGYAKGLGKTVIFVDHKHDKYFKFIHSMADVVCHNLTDAIRYLHSLSGIKG